MTKLMHFPISFITGHLLADHLEYLDDMIDKTLKMEESMEGLKDTYAKKKVEFSNIGWTDSAEIDRLFDTAALQKEEISAQLVELRQMMAAAKAKGFAVDAPDGTSDAMRRENLKQVSQIIDFAAEHEDAAKIAEAHAQSIRGVEAPDGTSDAMRLENLKQVNETIGYVVNHEEEILEQMKASIRGVEAPDGTSDAMGMEDLKTVDQIIDYAADHEDKEKIEYEHKMEKEVRKEQARNPEGDW